MDDIRHTLNELLVDLLNYILLIEEKNLRDQGVRLSMTEVHILEAIEKSGPSMISAIAKCLMVTQGTLTISTSKLVKKRYVERVKDGRNKRIVRLELTKKTVSILDIHNRFHEEMIKHLLNELELDKEVELIRSLCNLVEFSKRKYQSLFLLAGFFYMQVGEWRYSRDKRHKRERMLQAQEDSDVVWYQSESVKNYED